MYDSIVVGAGPSGGRMSANLSSKGYKVLMIDLKSEIGIPNHCSGLVDERVVNIVGQDLVIDKPQTAEIITPVTSFKLNSKRMFVIDRVALDKKLSEMAESEGSILKKRTRFLKYRINGKEIIVETFGTEGYVEYKTKYLIGADGPLSQVRNLSGIKSPVILSSVQFDIKEKNDSVKLYLNRDKTPDFFSWEIPHNTENEIGASGKGALEVVKHITGNRNIVRKRGGLIPIGPTELGLENIFLVGDAAGLNKATTGGGLYAALKSADSLSMAINNGSNILENYKEIWYNNFGKEILRDYEMRKILDKMEKYYKLWVPIVLTNVRGINAIGDVDYPSKILLYLMASSPLKINKIIKDFILLSNRNHNYSK